MKKKSKCTVTMKFVCNAGDDMPDCKFNIPGTDICTFRHQPFSEGGYTCSSEKAQKDAVQARRYSDYAAQKLTI